MNFAETLTQTNSRVYFHHRLRHNFLSAATLPDTTCYNSLHRTQLLKTNKGIKKKQQKNNGKCFEQKILDWLATSRINHLRPTNNNVVMI